MFLITGATGNVGRHVVTDLLDAKIAPVRAITRQPHPSALSDKVEIVNADLSDAEHDIRHALDGVSGLFLNSSATGERTQALLEQARAAGVQHVVLLSSCYVDETKSADQQRDDIGRMHRGAEELVEASGIAWTHLRADEFAANARFNVFPQIIEGDQVYGAYPDAASPVIHERDIAAAAAQVLAEGPSTHAGANYLLTGPASLTERTRVEIVGKVINRELTFVEVTPEAALAAMVSPYVPEGIAHAALLELEHRNAYPAAPTSDVPRLTGRSAISFERWVQEHAAQIKL